VRLDAEKMIVAGFAAALLLHSLGATPQEVMRDYLLTNELLKPAAIRGDWALPEHAAKVLYGVQPAFLDAALREIDENWGGMENYLRVGLGLGEAERQRLRELYLAKS